MKKHSAKRIKWGRLVGATAVALPLSIAVGFDAGAELVEKREPETASILSPFRGHALERLTYSQFRANVEENYDLQQSAVPLTAMALDAFYEEPLVPKSWAVLALAETDIDRRRAIINAAVALNKRDTFLQGVALSQAILDEDFEPMVSAVDRILRVRPRRSEDLFPILLSALQQPASAGDFALILDFTSPWHERFLMQAVVDPQARLTLSTIHDELSPDFDVYTRRLISGLAAQGESEQALAIYKSTKLARLDPADEEGKISWDSSFPPFDWALADRPELRAQVSLNEQNLEVFVRAGSGGEIARKANVFEQKAAGLQVDVSSQTELSPGNLSLAVQCQSTGRILLNQDLVQGTNTIALTDIPQDCEQIALALTARAFTGQPNLRAEVSQFEVIAIKADLDDADRANI